MEIKASEGGKDAQLLTKDLLEYYEKFFHNRR
jgi:protein subunit release factor A